MAIPSCIKWGHAVNDMTKMSKCFEDAVNMVEIDVRVRKQQSSPNSSEVVAAHDLEEVSSASLLSSLLQAVCANNKKRNAGSESKSHDVVPIVGVKLDFKEANSVLPTFELLRLQALHVSTVWLNADILQGPNGAHPVFDPKEFLTQCAQLKHLPLSLGWTTGRALMNIDESKREAYSCSEEYDCQTMVNIIVQYSLEKAELTFPVRACYIKNSWCDSQSCNLFKLLQIFPKSTLTVWTAKGDSFDLAWLQSNLPPERTYYDLP